MGETADQIIGHTSVKNTRLLGTLTGAQPDGANKPWHDRFIATLPSAAMFSTSLRGASVVQSWPSADFASRRGLVADPDFPVPQRLPEHEFLVGDMRSAAARPSIRRRTRLGQLLSPSHPMTSDLC